MSPEGESPLRTVRQMLENIRAAGIEWLPRDFAKPRRAPEQEADPKATLFDETTSDRPTTAMTPRQRTIELTMLAEKVSGCTRCKELAATRTQTVFGTGPLNPDICFIGEAPGADEDKQGEPFVGAAGKLLNKIIEACGLKREDVYIMNTIKCRPPGNRTPKPEEVENCREYFDRQLALVRPKYLVALGSTAAQNMLQTKASLGKLRGTFHEVNGIPMMATYHPAFLLPHRAPDKKKDVWEDMKMLLKKMGKPIPKGKTPG
jgi:DNA polymerase